MKVITRSKLEEMGGIYIENAIEGSNRYPYESKKCSEEEAIAWLLSLSREHDLYADFYASRIGAESLAILKEHMSEKEMEAVQELLRKCEAYEEEFIIFRPDEQELTVLVKLSYRELLFSTFYMADPAMTIWSNYDGEFVVFAKDQSLLKEMVE